MDYEMRLLAALSKLNLDELNLVLHFIEFLKQREK